MRKKKNAAADLFKSGCNCCQAVAAAGCGEYGVNHADAMRMAAAFGGGMRRGEVCGAATGALMLIGLKYGASQPEEKDKKAEADAKTTEYMKAFKERFGSYLCRDLIKAAGKKICDKLVPGAVELLAEVNAREIAPVVQTKSAEN